MHIIGSEADFGTSLVAGPQWMTSLSSLLDLELTNIVRREMEATIQSYYDQSWSDAGGWIIVQIPTCDNFIGGAFPSSIDLGLSYVTCLLFQAQVLSGLLYFHLRFWTYAVNVMSKQCSGSRGEGPGAELSCLSCPPRATPSADSQTPELNKCWVFYVSGLLWFLLDSITGAYSEMGTQNGRLLSQVLKYGAQFWNWAVRTFRGGWKHGKKNSDLGDVVKK